MSATAPVHFNFARDVVERWARERPEATALWCVTEAGGHEQKLTFSQLAGSLRRSRSIWSSFLVRGVRMTFTPGNGCASPR